MDRLVIASNNARKVAEIKRLLEGFYDEVVSLKDAGINVDVEEDGDTFHANAAKKATEISRMVEGDVLADDSGLCVEALDGAPGVHSARFSGDGADDEKNLNKLLRLMKHEENRKAMFVCALVLANGGEETLYVEDVTHGVIIDLPRGGNGFGYDPVFLNEEHGKTFAELDPDVKNAISHRGKALARLKEEIAKRR